MKLPLSGTLFSLLFPLLLSLAASAADQAPATPPKTATPPTENKQDQAAPGLPWSIQTPWSFEVERVEEGQTELDGRPIWYKDRGPAKIRFQVTLETSPAVPHGPTNVKVFVPSYALESENHGRKQSLRFDSHVFDDWDGGKRIRQFRSDGQSEDQAVFKALRAPWYELDWNDGAWSHTKLSAVNEAWPIADALALDRELALLLPALPPEELVKGQILRQAVVLPYPVPLSPPLTALVDYRVEETTKEDGHRIAVLLFNSNGEQPSGKGLAWGGIRLAGAHADATVSGRLKVDLTERRLREAELREESSVSKTGSSEPFDSKWKLKSVWKSIRK